MSNTLPRVWSVFRAIAIVAVVFVGMLNNEKSHAQAAGGLVARTEFDTANSFPRLRYSLKPCPAAYDCTMILVECGIANNDHVYVKHIGKGLGSIVASQLVFMHEKALTMRLNGERIGFSLVRLEKGEDIGDWIATFRPLKPVDEFLEALSRASGFEFWWFATVNDEVATIDIVEASDVNVFVSACRQRLDAAR